jgi:DNA-binding NtrC family response regulator
LPIALIVADAGFEPLEAANADQAIRMLEARCDIAMVFTDVDMSGTMDGLRLAHVIRNRWPPVLLILASGHAILEESQLPLEARFFAKPYAPHVIAETIRGLMGSQIAGLATMPESPDSMALAWGQAG